MEEDRGGSWGPGSEFRSVGLGGSGKLVGLGLNKQGHFRIKLNARLYSSLLAMFYHTVLYFSEKMGKKTLPKANKTDLSGYSTKEPHPLPLTAHPHHSLLHSPSKRSLHPGPQLESEMYPVPSFT